MNQMPVKIRTAQVIFLNEGVSNEGVSNQQILEMLKNEYPLDRSVNEKGVENYLLSLKAVGLIKLTSVSVDDNGNLKQSYRITDYGASRINYIS
ncbi:hypothetical protein [Desulfosporosinus sp. OT]|uniref:hypothetical protein n=1 Tax=Desulfosporosinus sp. OT TaxID=913865 RepID=UPI000223AEF1|nr:hypothetical protein [Desulfosporosinus sp. OT]EGW39611.1 hypothetical protein DOT_2454 [Desulfosporosinus sp. OT]